MDSKLQQAIMATRAGELETAQLLLTDALKEQPQDANVWFLLAHLVESPERQARYLEYTLALRPDHTVAAEHLNRLMSPEIPPPMFKDTGADVTSTHPTPPPTIDSEFVPIPPARTNAIMTTSNVNDSASQTAASSGTQIVKEQDSKRIDTEWQMTAGTPKRAVDPAAALPSQPQRATAPPARQPAISKPLPPPVKEKSRPPNKWLLAILLVMVALAFFMFSFLAFTLFFQ